MKSINNFILEKLKISSKHNLPSIDDFCNRFFKYIYSKKKTDINLLDLSIYKDFDIDKPESYNILPSYEFSGNESFLKMKNNRNVYIPKGTIYLISVGMFYDKDYYFRVDYILEGGIDAMDFKHPNYFYVSKEDLLDVIGEDAYLELYDYLEHYEKN